MRVFFPSDSLTARLTVYGLLLILFAACSPADQSGGADPDKSQEAAKAAANAETLEAEASVPPKPDQPLPAVLSRQLESVRYDLEGLKERGILRVLVGYSHTHYFMDGLHIRGISAENLKQFEPFLHKQLGRPKPRVSILPIPVARDQMIEFLAEGRGDIAIGNITITPDRAERVDFSVPLRRNVSEIIVHHEAVKGIDELNDLAGRQLHLRSSSSFMTSVGYLNVMLTSQGLAPVQIVPLDEHLQTEDVLELVSAGAVGLTVVDDHMAEFWAEVLDGIVVRKDLVLSAEREIAWAIRSDFTGMKPIVDAFVRSHRQGTLVGNVLTQRYLKENRYVFNASASADRRRFQSMADLFRRYSQEYDFDWLLIAAQGYQESRLVQSKRSHAGAVGVMQLLPTTAASPAVAIPNIEELEANIHAGHRYLRHIADRYFDEPDLSELDRQLLSFAAYNAGPTRISRLRREAARRGLDPNVWFGQVERVVAEKVGMEPVIYVRNIFKYYVTYRLMQDADEGTPVTVVP
ncbi:MAG: transporter substrate-binding domain-containing protein [Pseudomonadota bacterium]